MTIEITESLLSDIEAKAKTATHGNWVYEEVPVYNKPARMVRSANGYSVADIGLPEDGDHISRMDPPTTLALVSAHRAALARIVELEAQLRLADEQAAKNEALADHATRWDGAKLSALELAARRAALEEAAKECDRLAGGWRDYAAERRRAAGQWAAAIRSLMDKEPGQ